MRNLSEYLIANLSSLSSVIYENRVINFGMAGAKVHNGQCVILAGGAGSGKGTIGDKIDWAGGKTFDVDRLKGMYQKMQKAGKINDKEDYDLGDSDDTGKVHFKVKDREWKEKERNNFFNHQSDKKRRGEQLDNVLFDMTSKKFKELEEAVKMAKSIGYTVTVVWVVTNREVAWMNNCTRGIDEKGKRRMVSREVLDEGHDGVYNTMSDLFTNKKPELSAMIDYAWVGFGSGFIREQPKEYANSPVRKIKKDDKGEWIFDKSMVDKYINTELPIDYNAVDNMLKDIKEKVNTKKKNWEIMKFKLKEAAELDKELSNYLDEHDFEQYFKGEYESDEFKYKSEKAAKRKVAKKNE